jgi:hypothetical protein
LEQPLASVWRKLVPVVLADFLPLQAPAIISWSAIGVALGIGVLISVLFTLLRW